MPSPPAMKVGSDQPPYSTATSNRTATIGRTFVVPSLFISLVSDVSAAGVASRAIRWPTLASCSLLGSSFRACDRRRPSDRRQFRLPGRRRADQALCRAEWRRPRRARLLSDPRVRIRFAGFTSPWITGRSSVWRCVSADAASDSQRITLDGDSPGRPCARRTRARSVPSTQSIATMYRSSSKKSSRTSGSAGCGGTARSTRASPSSSSRAPLSGTSRIFRATTRSCCWSSAFTTRASPPAPSVSTTTYRFLISVGMAFAVVTPSRGCPIPTGVVYGCYCRREGFRR